MDSELKTVAIILAAGIGSRMKSDTTKQKMQICGKSVLLRTALAFENAKSVDGIVVVCRKDELDFAKAELFGLKKVMDFVPGGETRRDSARAGFSASRGADFVAIHDAARCMITPDAIDSVVTAAHKHGAASAVGAVNDTVKLVNADGIIEKTVPRDSLRLAQTPQVFSREIYKKAQNTVENGITDDNMMAESVGAQIKTVTLDCYNFKITTHADIEYAQFLLEKGYAK